jgi:hypothetical protein
MNNLTQNNHESMKTVVETFVIEETAELIYDNEKLDEWNRMVDELGLTGQSQVIKKEKSPVPFMHMNNSLCNVFEVLCPRKVAVESYNVTPIPVEILSLVSLSKKEEYFDKIEIWYDDKTPDPVCIGKRFTTEEARRKEYSWQMECYLIGKWADVKQSFAELTKRAAKRYRAQREIDLKQTIKRSQRELEDLDLHTAERFAGMTSF